MTVAMFHIVVQTVIVVVLLGAMVLLLLGIGKLFHPADRSTKQAADDLRRQLKEKDTVISPENLFHGFLARKGEKPQSHQR